MKPKLKLQRPAHRHRIIDELLGRIHGYLAERFDTRRPFLLVA